MQVDTEFDIQYVSDVGDSLTLDLYRPRIDVAVPVVVYLHGGGFRVGDKRDMAGTRLVPFAARGIAVASVNYRLAPATYPAPIHDVKAAVRWLRACGAERGLLVDRIGIWGASAGGYLATMIGLTVGDDKLEGTLGTHVDERSSVEAVIAWFAPSDLIANSRRSQLEGLLLGPPVETALFGRGEIPHDDAEALTASPLRRVHAGAPPFLIAHGDRDRIAMESESRALHEALTRVGGDATFCLLGGAGHEGAKFDSPANLALTAAWLDARLAEASAGSGPADSPETL